MKVKFKFDEEKFTAVMQILCQEVDDLDMNKALMLLYFIDKEHLLKYGRPILGDEYVKMDLFAAPQPPNK